MVNRLCVIGVGLIGGSLARALRNAGQVGEIVGAGRSRTHLETARALGVIDRFETDLGAAVQGVDLVVIAVPLGAMQAVFETIAPRLAPDTVLTDVGSAKGSVVAAAVTAFGELPGTLVPGHPIAGTEKSGEEASFAELFQHRRVILTPHASVSSAALEKVRAMWAAAGAQVVETSVEHHDQVLAATSHLPHMLAYALVDTLARMDDSREIFDYAAGGFRDFTRIASSDPQMWHDICVANRTALLEVLERFTDDLGQLTEAIRCGDSDYLRETFTRAKQERDQFCDTGDV
ncbi:MAG: prephenate dehydrogenase/arogenate dehydrogenase family protein [Pseudomonadota bacterium]|nr:MAG: prephenate dehydrogenase/arogenate dehydrogenase family protein [Pseudomonadota bacterium]